MRAHLIGPPLTRALAPSLLEALIQGPQDPTWLTFHLGRRRTESSRADVLGRARGWAAAFRARGVRPGDAILMVLPNGLEFVTAFFGAQLCGAVPVPVVWPAGLYTDPAKALEATAWQRSVVEPTAIACTTDFESVFPNAVTCPIDADSTPDSRPTADDPAFLQFTSGTEGSPRAIVITHRAAMHSATAMAQCLDLGPKDVGVSWLPLFHDMGLVGSLLTSLVSGFPLHVMTPPEFLLHPEHWLRTLSETKATITVAPNFAYDYAKRRIRSTESVDLRPLRFALNGSEAVQRATIESFEERFATCGLAAGTIRPVYGLAEATLGVAFELDRSPDHTVDGRLVPSVGQPLAGMEVSVRDTSLAELADLEEGEIWVRGPSVASEHLVGPGQRVAALKDGWLRTGDRGLKRDGRLHVTGREKDLIIRGGRKYPPYELERVAAQVANTSPSGALAVGSFDPKLGTEALIIVVECPEGRRDEVRLALPGRMVAELGIRPDRVELVDPGSLPRTSSGKLRRSAWLEETRV